MAAGVIERAFAFEVHGLRSPTSITSTAPQLLSTRELNLAALPEFAGYTVLPDILASDVSGYNWSSDPRRIVGSGGDCAVKLFDKAGVWGTQLQRNAKTDFYDLSLSSYSETAFLLYFTAKGGAAPPVLNQILWLEGEAIQITSAPTLVSGTVNTWTVLFSRGVCGSRAQVHRLDPISYYLGDDGKEDRLYLDARPNFASYLFTGALYLFRLDQFGAVVDYIKRFVYLDAPPTPLKGKKWEFRFKDIGDLLAQHQMGSAQRVTTVSHRLQAQLSQQGYGNANQGPADTNLYVPERCTVLLTRMEAERLFREPLHTPGSAKLESAKVTSLNNALNASTAVQYLVEVEASGKWLYRLSGAISYVEKTRLGDASTSLADNTKTPFVQINLDLVDKEFNTGVYSAEEGSEFSAGWTIYGGNPIPIGYDRQEAAPKVNLRVVLATTPVNALLYLCCSNAGNGADAYDKISGRVGLGLPSSWFNLGVTVANPIADPTLVATSDLLTRNQLHDEAYTYHHSLKAETKLADFLTSDICLLHSLLFGPLLNGKLTLRPWARVVTEALVALPTMAMAEVSPGSRLGRVRAMEIQSGINQLTLAPEYVRSIRARDVKLRKDKDFGEVQSVRIWQAGRDITTLDVSSGSLSNLVRSFLDLYGGEPVVYEVPTSMDALVDNSLQFGSFVTWSNADVLSYSGTGVSGTFLLFGYNLNWRTGEVTARLILDTFNSGFVDVSQGNGSITAPALRPARVVPLGGYSFEVEVEPIADTAANLVSAYGGIFTSLVAIAGLVRVTCPRHNVVAANEREGHLEAYATVTSVAYDTGRKRSVLRLTFDAQWERGSKTIARDILIPGEAIITLTDRRADGTHPASGATIEAIAQQLNYAKAGLNFTKVAGPQSFDKTLHLFGT